MATNKLILQGFTSDTHRGAIDWLFELANIKRILLGVAFANEAGVALLETKLRTHGPKTHAFVGIRNEITSLQGAKRFLDLRVGLHVVDTGSRGVIFHPKLYLTKGESEARVIVGSANLTYGGLNNNIEASLAVCLSLAKKDDREFVERIEREFDDLVRSYPKHVRQIGKATELEDLVKVGCLVDELTAAPPRPVSARGLPQSDEVPSIVLKVPRLPQLRKPTRASAPMIGSRSNPQAIARVRASSAAPVLSSIPSKGVEFELVWESKKLERRDLNIPTGSKKTNPTGSINLDKGLLEASVDHRHYFREKVFTALNWTSGPNANVEEAHAKFHLILKGISYGEFTLRIAHSTDRKIKSYARKNAMTRLSWGDAKSFVAREDLLGRTLSLYRDNADATRFVLEID